ncbi:MAG: glycosyltransferase family 2 protein [Myxococcota bacterium]|nr:glycosyltransferase family 2 protein [Myxococcota bacterium]
MELSIVMPCLNEELTLGTCIEKALASLQALGIEGEIVIGDNGSTDRSIAIAESLGARVVHVPIRGYGAALYHATQAAVGRFIIMGDSDDSYDFSNLGPFVERLRAGDDLVMGNRFQGGIAPGAMPWKNRYIGNPVLSAIGKVLFGCPVGDFHCGLRGFSREAFDRMDLRTTGMEYASEMVIKATLTEMVVSEVPTTLSPDGRDRPPHLRPWRDGWRHLRFMLLYSPRWLFFYPGIALTVLGLLLVLLTSRDAFTVGELSLDITTMLYGCAFVLLGHQLSAISVLTSEYAAREGLRPRSKWGAKLSRAISLEFLVLTGLALFTVGIVGSMYAVSEWGEMGFGTLDPRTILRIAIPSVLATILGVQGIIFGLLLGVLRLAVRKLELTDA